VQPGGRSCYLAPVLRGQGAAVACLVSVALACALLAGPAGAATTQVRGISDPALTNGSLPRATFLDRLAQSGAHAHRVVVSWQWHEPQAGKYSTGYLPKIDQNYRDELDRGVRQLIVLMGTPYWALTPEGKGSKSPSGASRCDGGTTACNSPPNVRDPAIMAAWKRWVTTVVKRYPQAVGIEVWNEPNLNWSWFQKQDPALYSLMLKGAFDAARAAGSPLPVVSAGLASYHGANDSTKTNYEVFLRTIYTVTHRDSFDAIGWHGYACNWQSSYHDNAARILAVLRKVKADYGDPAKPTWLTETGATSGQTAAASCNSSFNEQQQGAAIGDMMDWAWRENAANHDLPVLMIHSLFDAGGSGDYGLVAWSRNSSGAVSTRLKSAYWSLYCRVRGGC
jgi:hypothetical protein